MKCSECGEEGHRKTRHSADVPIDVPALGETLLDQLADTTAPERPADIVRAALRERAGKRSQTTTEAEAEEARRADQQAAIKALYGPDWEQLTPAAEAPVPGPGPGGLDEFLPVSATDSTHIEGPVDVDPLVWPYGELIPEDEAERDAEREQLAAHGVTTDASVVAGPGFTSDPLADIERARAAVLAPAGLVPLTSGPLIVVERPLTTLPQGPMLAPWRTHRGPAEPIRITTHGVWQLGSDEYHADPWWAGSLSNSDARRMTLPGCPAQFRYDRDAGVVVHKSHYDEGHAAHQLALGEGPEIVVRPAEWDSWRKQAAQAWRAEQYAAGRVPLDPDQFEMVQAMAAALRTGTPFVQQLMQQPGRAEQALFWLDQASGITRRAMIDLLPESRPNGRMTLVDYKTAESVAPDDDMSRKIYNYGYHRAAATYIDGVLALGLAEQVEMVFVFQSKTAPYLVTPVTLDVEALRIGRIQNREAIETYARCVESGYWPGYTEGVETLGVPAWIEKRYQDVA